MAGINLPSIPRISDADLEAILFAGGQAAVGGADFKSLKLYAVQDPELLKAINETIAEIKADGRLAKWIADYTAEADKLKDK